MTTLAAFLMSMIGPLAIRVLTMVGISILTFTGVTESLDFLIQGVKTNYAGLPSDLLGLAGLAGVPQAIGLILGAMSARVAVWTAASATRWVTGK
ncbi:MAG: DUF2523 domain-containing protein [Burkholderiaceae bacterium]|nr:DUF2523 domain-containing protein [Burkholderiaceae bacterium]